MASIKIVRYPGEMPSMGAIFSFNAFFRNPQDLSVDEAFPTDEAVLTAWISRQGLPVNPPLEKEIHVSKEKGNIIAMYATARRSPGPVISAQVQTLV